AQRWTILVQDGYDEPASLVTLGTARGLATSSTLRRSWQRDGRRMHHILDPRTALPAPTVWRSVSVAAETCLEANIHSTATVVRGTQGLASLRQRGLPCRLVRDDGSVVALNGWPA
ncbi:MAG: FAD:protein FMN transferase, partial [Lapillicoccus sp.]